MESLLSMCRQMLSVSKTCFKQLKPKLVYTSWRKNFYSKAKQMIQDILSRGHAVPPSDGPFRGGGGGMGGGLGGGSTVEMYVPGPRVGLVIGKNGEMIKHIQVTCSYLEDRNFYMPLRG